MYRSISSFAERTVFSNKWIYLLVPVLGCLVLTSCVSKPELVRIDDIKILGVQDSVMTVQLAYVVYNPNIFKAKISRGEVEAFFGSERLGTAVINEPLTLQAKDTSQLHMKVSFDLDRLESVYPDLIEQDSAVFRIVGKNTIRLMTRNFTLNVDEYIALNTKLFIQEQVKKNLSRKGNFAIESVSIRQLPSLSKVVLDLKVGLLNELPLDYTVEGAKLRFYARKNEDPVAEWQLEEPFEMKAFSKISLPVEVELRNFNLLKNFDFGWIGKGGMELRMEGNARLSIKKYTFGIPIKQNKLIRMRGIPSLFE